LVIIEAPFTGLPFASAFYLEILSAFRKKIAGKMKIIRHSDTPEITPNTRVRSSITMAAAAVLNKNNTQTG